MKVLPKAPGPVKLNFDFAEEEAALREALEQHRHWTAKVESKRKAIDEIRARLEAEHARFETEGLKLDGAAGDSEKLEKLVDRYHKATSSLSSERSRAGLDLALAEKGVARQLEQVRAAQEAALQAIEEAAQAELVKVNDRWLEGLELCGRAFDEALAVRALAKTALRTIASKMERPPGTTPPDSIIAIRLERFMPLAFEFQVNIAGGFRAFKLDRLGAVAIRETYQERGAA